MNDTGTLLGKEIRRLRQLRGMSQEELAYLAGISAPHLGQIERAQKNPTVETISHIAASLNVTLSELFSFDTAADSYADSNLIINKINAYLKSMSEAQQRDALKIIRILAKKA